MESTNHRLLHIFFLFVFSESFLLCTLPPLAVGPIAALKLIPPVLQDLTNMNAKNVCVITDKNLEKLPPMKAALDSLHANKVTYKLFSDVSIEPTDHRYLHFFALILTRRRFACFLVYV